MTGPVQPSALIPVTILRVNVHRFSDGSVDVDVDWLGEPPPGDQTIPAMATAGIAALNATIVESLGVSLGPVVGARPEADDADADG